MWVGQEGPRGQWWGLGRQLRRGADLSLVTVGFSWTLAKGFLRREEKSGFSVGGTLCHLGCPTPRGPPSPKEGPASEPGAGRRWNPPGTAGAGCCPRGRLPPSALLGQGGWGCARSRFFPEP